ncbi:MAG: hypothetical protein SNH27_11025 [Rikenellaceae bacterium]
MKLSEYSKKIISLCAEILKQIDGIYPSDLMVTAISNRSVNIINAYNTLVEANNYIGANSLIRIQLDSCLRFYALTIAPPDDVASHIFAGKRLDKYKHNNELFTDNYLATRLSEHFDDVLKLYKYQSSFIHFDEKLMQIHAKNTGGRTIQVHVGSGDMFSDDEKNNADMQMMYVCSIYIKLLESYLKFTKETNSRNN